MEPRGHASHTKPQVLLTPLNVRHAARAVRNTLCNAILFLFFLLFLYLLVFVWRRCVRVYEGEGQ